MLIKIVNIKTDKIIVEKDFENLKIAVRELKADLREADLYGADLRGANLYEKHVQIKGSRRLRKTHD